MRKLLIILFLMIPSLGSAGPEVGLLFKGGPAAATVAEDNRYNRYGFSGGLGGHLQWPVIDPLSLAGQIELLYTQRGAKAVVGGEYLGRIRAHYLDLTTAVRPMARLGPVSIYLLLGGEVSFLSSANKEVVGSGTTDITGELRRLDVALLGGAGVALHLPGRRLGPFRLGTAFVEARYDYGLIDTDAINGGYKNRTSSLMLGLAFVLTSQTRDSPPVQSDPPVPATSLLE